MDLHALGQWLIRQQIVETGIDQRLASGLGSQGRALDNLLDPGRRSRDMRAINIADIKADARVVWHNIGRLSAGLDDIVDTRGRLNMFAHEVDPMQAEFSGVHGAAAQPGRATSMRALAEKFDFDVVNSR